MLIIYPGKLLDLSFVSNGDASCHSARMKLDPGAPEKAVLRPVHPWEVDGSSSILTGATLLNLGGNSGWALSTLIGLCF